MTPGATRGATPLTALEAIAFDSETTGLNTGSDRIVQIAGIGLSHGRINPEDTFETLVDPRAPIPPRSTELHGIDDAKVRNAPVFPVALARFEAFRRGRIAIGYSIGFDFAILAKEAGRVGLNWEQPRSLCIRLLGALVYPAMADPSLEVLAAGLRVKIHERHSAPGDAAAAAEIFIALLPRLRERGITTLAEAERACLQMTDRIQAQQRAGWAPAVSQPGEQRALAQVDPYAYRHRVGDIMSHPVHVVAAELDLRGAIATMVENRISSVLVATEASPGQPVSAYGILTERDVMRRIAAEGERAFSRAVGEVASRPLKEIGQEAFVYRAMGRMERFNIRHLAVRDEHEALAGIISARDLLKLRGGAAIRLDDAIEVARSAGDMAQAWAMLPEVAWRLIEEAVDANIVAGIVSEELRAMTRRAAILAEQAMEAEGFGLAPCDYALMVLGSGGRGESLLAADQDNAIIFAEGEVGGAEDRWFAELGKRIADTLNTAGIPYCQGGVMAKNAPWRGSVELWRKRIRHWVGRSDPQDLLNVDIFFDQRPVHGHPALATDLFDYAFEWGHASPAFAKLLGDRLGGFGTPFTLFGGLRTSEGRIDLKKHGLFAIVSVARALAIRHDIRQHGTKARLEGLLARQIGSPDSVRALLEHHALLMSLLLSQQSQDLTQGIPVSNSIAPDRLSARQRDRLKEALHVTSHMDNLFRSLVTALPPAPSST